MKRFYLALRHFFSPPSTAPRMQRLMPYTVLGVLTLIVAVGATYAWDYTNSSVFCGTSCHTMPPEYSAYQISPHARIACVECHIGREFVGNQIFRKAGDAKHIIALAFTTYEFPITAGEMRPARETCERCHSPEKFSDDSFRQLHRYDTDTNNTANSIFLFLKTGGGNAREGLGRGIHWHIQNKILYYPTDRTKQTIPYVRVYNDDGTTTEYVDIEANFDPATVDESKLEEMDCITCHNRITHLVDTPEDALDEALAQKLIDAAIPDIRAKGAEVMRLPYTSDEQALSSIATTLADYYRVFYPDYYAQHRDTVDSAITAVQALYRQSVYMAQKSDWNSHPNNTGHKNFPGCFRCHDGKHLNEQQEAVRLECNLCHSIPVISGPQDFVTNLEVSRGPEPESHLNANWIAGHRNYFDRTCALCHTTGNPGGTDNSSFCSNAACHGSSWKYAGLDAPGLAEIVAAQLPTPEPEPTLDPSAGGSYTGLQPLFDGLCGLCHGDDRAGDLKLTTYADLMAGGANGPVLVPGDPEASLLIQVQRDDHFGKLTSEQLDIVAKWIANGAPEK